MAYTKVILRSPADVEIVGILLENGNTANVSLHYDLVTGHQDVVIDHSGYVELRKHNEELICVDKNNTQWSIVEVISHSMQHHSIE